MKMKDPMKPENTWEVRRKIMLMDTDKAIDSYSVESALERLKGIRKAIFDPAKKQVWVRYDVTETNFNEVQAAIESSGHVLLNTWWNRFKAGWFQYMDTNERNNARTPPRPCCNKPPK